jgi:Ferritin-like domain
MENTTMINRTTGAPEPAVDIQEPAGTTRGAFLLKSVMATGAAYGAVGVGPVVSRALAAGGGGDIAIAQFALLLEHLETAFYEQAAKLKLSGDAKRIASEFGAQEAAHVTALTKAIKGAGGKPAKPPTFAVPMTDQASFLKLAYTIENVGVGAYNGAGPMLKSKDLLAAAGSIVQIEARHAAVLGLLTQQPPAPNAFDKGLSKAKVTSAVKPLIKA